jgi:hypothetical protein
MAKTFARVAVRVGPGSQPIHGSIRVNGQLTSVALCGLRAIWTNVMGPTFDVLTCPECIAIRDAGTNPMTRLMFVDG